MPCWHSVISINLADHLCHFTFESWSKLYSRQDTHQYSDLGQVSPQLGVWTRECHQTLGHHTCYIFSSSPTNFGAGRTRLTGYVVGIEKSRQDTHQLPDVRQEPPQLGVSKYASKLLQADTCPMLCFMFFPPTIPVHCLVPAAKN